MATRRSNRNGSARSTIDHDEIRAWVEERGGQPSVVASTRNSKGPGILRIDFPGFSGEGTLKPIPWEDFFERFDQANLAFLYQGETTSGRRSRFNKFVAREGETEKESAPRSRGRRTTTTSRKKAGGRTGSARSAGTRSAGTRGATRSTGTRRASSAGTSSARGSAGGSSRTAAKRSRSGTASASRARKAGTTRSSSSSGAASKRSSSRTRASTSSRTRNGSESTRRR